MTIPRRHPLPRGRHAGESVRRLAVALRQGDTMSDWRDIHADQNLRLAQKMLEQQGEINALRAERDQLVDERDAARQSAEHAVAANRRARAEAERWRNDLKSHGQETWAVAARHVCAMILAALEGHDS